MSTWLIVVLGLYIIGVLGFLVAMYIEAPKHGVSVGLPHYVVSIVWPGWALWYGIAVASDYFRKRKA